MDLDIKHLVLFVIWCLLFGASPVCGIEWGGYYENDALALQKRIGGSVLGDMNRLRLKFDQKVGENAAIHFESHYNAFIKSENIPLIGVSDLDQLVWDRVYVKAYFPIANLTVGKQRIAWGTGYIWNPTDVFNPFVLAFAIKEEEESNAQAVRLEIPIGVASGLDGYIVTNASWNDTKKGLRVKTNIGLFDLSLSYVNLGSGGYQLGFDSAGDVLGFGVRNEIVYKVPNGMDPYFQSVWGGEYTLDNGVGLNLEYYSNSLGKKNKADYDWIGLYTGKINELGADYLFFSANKSIDEITEIRASWLANLNDLSFIFYPAFSRNIAQNLDWSLELLIMAGEEGTEFYPSAIQDPSGLSGSRMLLTRFTYSF